MVRGDFSALLALIERIAGIPSMRRRLIQEGALEARRQVRLGFVQGRDPYGKRWAAVRRAGGMPLRETGRLADFTARLDATGFWVEPGAPYAATHQYGATIKPKTAKRLRFQVDGATYFARKVVIPQRMMVPEGDIGPIWATAFAARFNSVMTEQVGG